MSVQQLMDEGLLPIFEAVQAVGIPASQKTVYRWVNRGVNGVLLESVKVGGTRMTSERAVRRFVAAQQENVS